MSARIWSDCYLLQFDEPPRQGVSVPCAVLHAQHGIPKRLFTLNGQEKRDRRIIQRISNEFSDSGFVKWTKIARLLFSVEVLHNVI